MNSCEWSDSLYIFTQHLYICRYCKKESCCRHDSRIIWLRTKYLNEYVRRLMHGVTIVVVQNVQLPQNSDSGYILH